MNAPAKPTREERLAAKLRENLHRRKAQARAFGDDGASNNGTLAMTTDKAPALSKGESNG